MTAARGVVAIASEGCSSRHMGLGVIEAESEDDARSLAHEDPAVKSRMSSFEVYPMLDPFVRS